jgi:hypothetical protein
MVDSPCGCTGVCWARNSSLLHSKMCVGLHVKYSVLYMILFNTEFLLAADIQTDMKNTKGVCS